MSDYITDTKSVMDQAMRVAILNISVANVKLDFETYYKV